MFSSNVGVPEWLSGMTRNHVGSARAGSNPAAHAFWFLYIQPAKVRVYPKPEWSPVL